MSRNGSGTYNLPAGNPVVTGTTISSTWANSTLSDMATALTQSIAYDGQTTPVANLPMGTYAHTNVGNATARTMYASAGQVEDGTLNYLTSVSGTNAITATAPVSMSAYVAGQTFRFIAAGANTGAVTLNLNAIGAKAVTRDGTTALVANDIVSGGVYQVVYDGTQFQLTNSSNASVQVTSFSAGTTGLTPNTATTGAITLGGTLGVANGGTGLTSFTSGQIHYGSFSTNANFVFDGTNLGVGTSSPSSYGKLAVSSGSGVGGYFLSTGNNIVLDSNPNNTAIMSFFNGGAYFGSIGVTGNSAMANDTSSDIGIIAQTSRSIRFYTNGASERMRIDSSGNLLVGTTSVSDSCKQTLQFSTGNNGLCVITPDNINGVDFSVFRANGAVCGRISRVGTTSAVVYTTTSDKRLKENITDAPSALEYLNKIKVRSFDWKDCGHHITYGVIAQEFIDVEPDAVLKGDDEEEIIKTWSVDTSVLVPAMIKAIQEQQELIKQLQTDVAALKGKA